ncbi:MAG: substrate-binding domain-containing protein, partial [bacterium]
MKETRKNGLILTTILVAFCLALLPSCSKKEAPEKKETGKQAEEAKEKVIGVSLLVQTHDFYKDLQAGLEEAAETHGFKLLILSGEMDVNKQIMQVQNFITQKVDAIIVCPADTNTIGSAVMEANKAGVPVFTADIRSASGDIVSHIASDNVMGGREAGMYMAKLFEGQEGVQVGIIDNPEASSVQERVKGFLDEIGKHPNMEVVVNLNGHGLRDAAMKVAMDMLQGNPDLDAV